jgi:hypothetical protein
MEAFTFDAVMGRTVIMITCAACALLLALAGMFLFLHFRNPGRGAISFLFLYPAVLCLLLVLALPFLRVRSYVLNGDELRINLGYGTKVFSLAGLREVRRCPDAFAGAIRTLGNGGLFSVLGRFRSDRLGAFRAYVSDPDALVLLEWNEERVVISPADPGRFIELVSRKVTRGG